MELTQIDWLEVARLVLLSRHLDQLEVNQLAPQGSIKYQFSSSGHELAQVLLAQALDHAHDSAIVYYRSRPFALASGLSAFEALAGGMARHGSPTAGRDTGVMYNLPRSDGLTLLPPSGDVGAQYTPAAGWAQAITYRQRVLGQSDWDGAIAVAMGGDGSVASNGFWAALNISTTLRLPLLIFIEDNRYGLSVPSHIQTPGGNIAENLASYNNLKIIQGDGTDPIQALDTIQAAVAHVRSGEGPCLLRLEVVRLTGHTFIDDQTYKSTEIIAAETARDPVKRLEESMLSQGVSQNQWDDLVREVQSEIKEAFEAADASPDPDTNQTTRHLYFEGVGPAQGGLRTEGVLLPMGSPTPKPSGPRINLVDAVRRTLELELKLNPRMVIFGEDVGRKGGVHGATRDLQSQYGIDRVFDTSLSEEGIMGRSVGMALAGLLPVPEIQFRKYADPAHEQISDIGTLRWRTANRFAAPVIVRIPVGYGKVTGDPWHSVTGEAIYAHTLGWRIAFPSNAEDAVGLLRSALRGDDPTIFFEHRALLDTAPGRRPYPGDDFCLPFGSAAQLSQGNELTVVTWGAMVSRCLEAASNFPDRVSVIDLRTIIPWDQEMVLQSVRQTGKALVVHEDTLTAGFAGEIIATIASQAFTYLDAPIQRLAVPDIPIPYNISMMESILPSVERIQSMIKELLIF